MSEENVKSTDIQIPDFATWEDEQVGFAPYWKAEIDAWFLAKVVARDERDPEFVRYLMQAAIPTPCFRGEVEEAEAVTVPAGEFFTISVYYSLQELFNFYLDSGTRPTMKCTVTKKVKTGTQGRSVYNWRVQVSPDDKKRVEKARDQIRARIAAKKEDLMLSQNNSGIGFGAPVKDARGDRIPF